MPLELDPPIEGSLVGRYATQTGITKLIGALNRDILGDLDADNVVDPDAVPYAIQEADLYVDRRLMKCGVGVPYDMVGGNPTIMASLPGIADHVAVWIMGHYRGLESIGLGSVNQSSAQIAGDRLAGYLLYADKELADICVIVAGLDPDDTIASAGSFEFVPIDRAHECVADENSV